MNSACLIAACAANSRARRKDEEKANSLVEELYYKVNLRKYYRFDPLSLADFTAHICERVESNTSVAPMPIKIVNVDTRSYAVQQSFSVRASKCSDGIDSYIRENLEQVTSSDDWLELDKQVINDYIKYVDLMYGIEIQASTVIYTTEYYWEVN